MLLSLRARREFGFEAQVDFREGLRKTVDWYVETREEAKTVGP